MGRGEEGPRGKSGRKGEFQEGEGSRGGKGGRGRDLDGEEVGRTWRGEVRGWEGRGRGRG